MKSQIISRTGVAIILLGGSLCIAQDNAKGVNEGGRAGRAATTATGVVTTPARITSKIDIEPVRKLTDKEAREVSFAAGRLLGHVARARVAIHDKEHAEATRNIDQALKLMDIIEAALPHYTVTTSINAGKRVYHEEEDVTPRYVTLFDELERVDLLTPIARAKKTAQRQRSALQSKAQRNKPKGQANKPSGAKLSAVSPPIVSQADLEHSTMRLDVRLAKQMLDVAKSEMAGNNHDKHLRADAALQTIQAAGVVFEVDEVNLPLERVADNLRLAETEITEGRRDSAKAALQAAADDLDNYGKKVGTHRLKEVKALRADIDKLAKTLEKVQASSEDAKTHAATISKMWHTVTKWLQQL